MVDIEKQVERVLGIYQSAVRAKDTEALMRLYDPKVRVFDAWGVWSYEGAPAWQVAVEGWFASLGSGSVVVSFEGVQTIAEREFAAVSAIVSYAGQSAQAAPLQSMHNRMSWVMRVSGHVLRIVHEHSSVPIGFEDQKAILQRTPRA